jgi:hypothetical protein
MSSSGQEAAAPSASSLTKAVTFAIAGAAILLVTVVLPAEYGIDPLGTGEALGLSALRPSTEPVAPPPVGDALEPTANGPIGLYARPFSVDSREFVLGPYEYVEYKYHLAQNAVMLFSWSATDGVIHDFHGDRDGAPASAAESFDTEPRQQADGTFTAPFSGIHGWYWENPGGDTIRIRVTTSGFYTAAHEFSYRGTREARPIADLAVIEQTPN